MRPTAAHEKNAITRIESGRLGPTTETRAIANSRNGNDSTRSMSRARTHVDRATEVAGDQTDDQPSGTASAVESTPTSSEIRAPYTTRMKMSRPRLSVPNQNWRLGPTGSPAVVRPVSPELVVRAGAR